MIVTGSVNAVQVAIKTENYTLTEGDHLNIVTFNSAAEILCTIPKGLRIGYTCTIVQQGTGKIKFITPDGDNKVNGGNETVKTGGTWAWAKLLCIEQDTYTVDFSGASAGGGGGAQTLQEVLMGGNVANNQITLTNSYTDVVNKITNDSIEIMGELESVTRRAIFTLSKIKFRYDGTATIEQLRAVESHLLFPRSGVEPKVIIVSVNGVFANEDGNIILPINGGSGITGISATDKPGQSWTIENPTTSPIINLQLTKEAVGLSNVPNVNATSRANHTGTQLAATISDFIEIARQIFDVTNLGTGAATYDPATGLINIPQAAQSLTDVTTGQGFNETVNPFYSFNQVGIKQNETVIASFLNEGGVPVLFMAQEGNNGNFELRDEAATSFKKVKIPIYTESGDYDLAFNSQIIEITENYEVTNFNSALDFINPERTAYIPTASTNRGKEFVFINSSEGNCYIQTINDELIGNFFQVLSRKCAVKRDQCITIKSNGIGYKIISKSS